MMSLRRVLAAAVVATCCASFLVLAEGPAEAAPRVTITNGDKGAVANADGPSSLTIKGSGFQSIKGGFGGIYVLFGWIDGANWRPSRGGVSGKDFRYVPDSQTKSNKGYEKFVAYPGSETAYAANGGLIAANGTISLTLNIPGPSFDAVGTDSKPVHVDCLKVTCGVITIGAHGVVNPANESFTPVSFQHLGGSSTPAANSGTAGTTSGTSLPPAAAPVTKAGPATITVDRATAIAGRVMTFRVSGLAAGEQAVVTLDDGLVSVGPLTAAADGSLVGIIQLPVATEAGTHTLRLVSSASGKTPQANFPVRAGDPAAAAASDSGNSMLDSRVAAWCFLGVAAVALAGVIALTVLRLRRARRPRIVASRAAGEVR